MDTEQRTEVAASGEQAAYRVAHPQAKALFNLLRHAPEVDRRHVLSAVRSRSIEAASPRSQLTLNALRVCLADSGRLSRPIYDKWRAAQPDPREWPSSQQIINIFRSWRRALDAAGADVVGEVLSRRLVANGQPFTRQEILESVQAYAATGGELTWAKYCRWAQDQMQRPDRVLPRVIRSVQRINQLFGTWADLLAEAGLSHEYAEQRKKHSGALGRRHEYDPDRVIEWVQTAGAELGGEAMTVYDYDGWAREVKERELAASGRLVSIPASATVSRILGSWAEALHRAGLMSREEALFHHRRGAKNYTDAELITWLARALAEGGKGMIAREYARWRLDYMRARDFRGQRPPGPDHIRKRLGGWPAARRLAQLQVAKVKQSNTADAKADEEKTRG